jgi:phycocyanin-associated, rod
MLGRSVLASGTSSDNRVFVYEVAGLRQNDQTEGNNHEIRPSSNVMMRVPFSRMNEFMQRIQRQGGTIVSIHTGDAEEVES